ncbi:MAG: (Fe-S)-binding protein [Thermodesulfobacteriota bacterium]|nr:(Fe-S)-binding protein [Thermodesulfobacteriota bacterium]
MKNIYQKEGLVKLIKEMGIYQCLDCAKCTGACPIAETGKEFSPRLAARKLIEKGEDDPQVKEFIWACLTCGRCDEICPSGVNFSDFVRLLRSRWIASGKDGIFSHGGAMFSLMRMMSSPGIKQNRKALLPSDIKTQSQGKVLYFTGCLPYFDVFFKNLGLNMVQTAIDAVKILNQCNIAPVILDNERCCGHDLFWAGDEKGFVRLAKESYSEIKDHGATELITTCPECFYTFKEIFPKFVDNFELKVTHIYELISKELNSEESRLDLKPLTVQATFKDSCRLKHFKEISHATEKILKQIPGLDIIETPSGNIGDICCGNSAWVGCGAHSKTIQMKRLKETLATQSDLLITTCPKCIIHLQCTMNDFCNDERLKIKDMVSVIADALD